VRFIASSTQIVPDEKGMDEWGNYPLERKKLFELIQAPGIAGVVLLSGNAHFAELSRWDGGASPIFELTSSGLTHVNEAYARHPNRYRVGEPYADLNFGLVEIDWHAEAGPAATLQIRSLDGAVVLERAISP